MELNGNNFVLRKWRETDAPLLQKNANDRQVSATLLDRFPYPYTLTDAVNFINIKIKEEIATNFAIDIEGEVAGVISVDIRPDIYRKTPLLGYWISPRYRNKGIVTQATMLITNYAFKNLILYVYKLMFWGITLHLCGCWRKQDLLKAEFCLKR